MFTCRKTAREFHTKAELDTYVSNGYKVEEKKKRAPRKSAIEAPKPEVKEDK